ncbi:radical SAM protein [Peptostreptococcus faecalis]|uniref:radical SAM protein n=1 Tax=Peptostreptococcus faecalis TaxID=2045015 RepID=UPI000C7DA04C|nr:radical SAM protein [Peptostreptococcus faecalis]
MNNERFGKLFKIEDGETFFFDSGTGKVLSCDVNDEKIISNILENKISVQDTVKQNPMFGEIVKKESLFKCPEKRKFMVPSKIELESIMKGNCEQIIFELTEICNLRCGYCIYNDSHPGFRNFGKKNLSFEIGKKTIDYVLKDFKREKFNLTFYGGEPLVNFKLMKRLIDYVIDEYPMIKLSVSFTTNATLISKEMIDYFNSLDEISILCSIDGPKEIHDRFRRYENKKGSFEDSVRGFNLLRKYFYKKNSETKQMSINTVICPPLDDEKLKHIKKFFEEELDLPDDIEYTLNYVDEGDMVYDYNEEKNIADLYDDNSDYDIENWAMKGLKSSNDIAYIEQIKNDILRISNRPINKFNEMKEIYFHGNCIPGQRRLYVNVDGDFRVCERTGDSPFIGNYNYGYDFDAIYKNYYQEHLDYFNEKCKTCWAHNLCSICYSTTMNKDGLDYKRLDSICKSARGTVEKQLEGYYTLLKYNRDLLENIINDSEEEFSN